MPLEAEKCNVPLLLIFQEAEKFKAHSFLTPEKAEHFEVMCQNLPTFSVNSQKRN